MNTQSNFLGRVSQAAATPERVLRIALAALQQRDFVNVIDQFSDQFTFIDYALTLEFNEKERLIEFFRKTRELFPDSVRKDDVMFTSRDRVISQWKVTATKTESFIGGNLHIPISVEGVSIVQVENGKISRWLDYYDSTKSRRNSVASWFTGWIEV